MKILNLDIKSKNTNIGQVEKCDTVKLICTLEEKDYSNSIIRILGKKADKTFVEQFVQAENNKIDVTLKDQFTTCEGITRIEVNIVENGQEWTSNENYFYVSSTLNSEIIESKDSIDTLEKVDKFVEIATTELDEFKIIKDDLTIANTEMKKDEICRKGNELLRLEAEKTRLKNEILRDTTEEDRQVNELDRITSENDRKVNEVNRKLAENLRNNAETVRVTSELKRQDTFEANEELRNSNENIRIKNEEDRNKHFETAKNLENSRKVAEENRKTNELDRKSNEEVRKTSEEGRKVAEENREETYTNFNDAEMVRKANEETRVSAENLRVNAEKSRDNRYEVAENKRNSDFGINETIRSNAFISSEKNRSATFIENEEVRNAAFIAKENTREENEDIRKKSETARVTDETKRIDVEKTRISNEVARVNSETLRNNAETTRVNAENLRVVAEENREEKVNEIKNSQSEINTQLSNITKEITEARVDYFGKEHATLKEKEDREFEFVHVDNSKGMFVEQSTETGNMKIENSIEGRARDTIMKGRTLHNLISYKNIRWTTNKWNNFVPFSNLIKTFTVYTLVFFIREWSINKPITIQLSDGSNSTQFKSSALNISGNGIHSAVVTSKESMDGIDSSMFTLHNPAETNGECVVDILILEGEPNIIPTYFEGIKSLGEEENKISILSTGKNLLKPLDESMFDFPPIRLDNYSLIAGGRQAIKYNIELEPNTDYVFSCKAKPLAGSSEALVRWFENGILKGSMVLNKMNINSQSGNIQLAFYVGQPFDVSQVEYSELMLQKCKNTNDLNFQVYQQDKKDILLPVPNGCKGLPNGVGDEVLANCDYLQRIEKKLLSVDDSWIYGNPSTGWVQNTDYIAFYSSRSVINSDKKINGLSLSDRFATFIGGHLVSSDKSEGFSIGHSSYIIARIDKKKLETPDAAGFNKWLQANPTTVYYELAEPILHKAETLQNLNLSTFKDITHVSCLNKIAPNEIKAKFPVDVAATFSRLNRENKQLENKNTELENDLIEQAQYFNDKDLDLMTSTLDLDFRLLDIELVLEIPINLNMKGMNNMNQYEMMKTLILAGRYEREDMEIKVAKYLKYNKITQEQADELIALMDAREIIQN